MSTAEPLCLQIAALGGQGGGLLADWLAEAAHLAGYPAQVTSIPGVAQRTGATTYYLELSPEKDPPAPPAFSLFPDTDGLDLMVALEPLEAARALDLGLITERTTVITGRRRIYSTAEKAVAGDGAIPTQALIAPLERAAARVIQFDIEAVSGRPGAPGNAVMFGAILGSGLLPLDEAACRAAITAKAVSVAGNLADFEAGLAASRQPSDEAPPEMPLGYDPPPSALAAELAAYPEALRPLVGHALARLADYQDEAYARVYLQRLAPLLALDDDGGRLLAEVAKRLAAWMSYEDVIRVAQLKTRPGRLARIRGELGLDGTAALQVTDFLKPGREELASLLPPALGRRLLARPQPDAGLRLRLPTSSAWGYGLLKLTARLKPWRPRSYRYACEQAAIEGWLEAVRHTATVDRELAVRLAELAVLARGYGEVRARGLAALERLTPNWAERLGDDPDGAAREVENLLWQARNDPDEECRIIGSAPSGPPEWGKSNDDTGQEHP
jgi:indolepyruvate ferredoxin oxidoreductase beta subunit